MQISNAIVSNFLNYNHPVFALSDVLVVIGRRRPNRPIQGTQGDISSSYKCMKVLVTANREPNLTEE